jgi:hypothetical protein
MHSQLFDDICSTLRAEGAGPAIERLCATLRESGEYHLLFYARLLQKRHELGVSPIPTGPAAEVPAEKQPAYEVAIREAAREAGSLYLQAGMLPQAWGLFRMIDEPAPVRQAIEAAHPAEDDDVQGLVQLAFYEGLAPKKGFDLLLQRYGTCSAITTLSSGEAQLSDDVKQHCVKALVRRLYSDLCASLRAAIAEAVGTAPEAPSTPEEPPGTLAKLMEGRDYLFGEDAYHIDTSHLSSVVQMAMSLSPSPELDQARELAAYGARLSGRFLGQDDFPFDRGFADYGVYLDILRGQDVEAGVAHFRGKLESADPEEIGSYPAEVLVNLYLKLGRGAEALAVARKHLANVEGRPLSCPNLNELCQKLGDYQALAETAREQGDPVHYLAGLIAASNRGQPSGG